MEVLTPAEADSHLLSFTLRGYTPATLRDAALALSRTGLVVRSIDHAPFALRASFGWFNDEADVLALVRGIAALPPA